ncbi:MAG: UTP--glucose-1-phosphate uridylyltransferase, partial [Bdellovibrionales bacterium]|nr:UTP--glucose-1-phosphate uridylyltransferase [Bdellovibrionales bacterium]
KIKQSNLHPIDFPENQELEWCPPGHGDVYTCLNASGLLSTLLSKGYKYAFISNIDNLGAEFDPRIAGFIANKKISFLMEVAKRNMSDKKGGHLAKSKDGKILLRERAQCPENELQYFEDTDKYSYFNTNSIWINLEDLKTSLDKNGGFLDLPLIVNSKTVDPSIPSSETIFQLETAMGAAISAFDNAMAIHVPRSRFAPVKTTNDLLELWSSNFELNSEYSIVRKSTRPPVNVILDPNYYQNIEDFQRRFPIEVPNIENCVQLEVVGNVVFPKDLILEGVVKIVNNSNDEKQIKGNQTLSGEIVL